MAQVRKIFHVEFNEPIDGKKHYYFGSKSAIFQRFSAEQVGITYKSVTLEVSKMSRTTINNVLYGKEN